MTSPPCMCFLAAHPQVIELSIEKLKLSLSTAFSSSSSATSSSATPSIECFLPIDKVLAACRHSIQTGKLNTPEWIRLNSTSPSSEENAEEDEGGELKEVLEKGYKVLFGLIKNALTNVKPHPESVLALIKAQGGSWTWELARKFKRAIVVGFTVTDEQWR